MSMKIADILRVKYDSFSQELIVASTGHQTFAGVDYNVYYMANGYVLYEKKGYVVDNPLDVKGHLVLSEEEIKGGDYYLKVSELPNSSNINGNANSSLEHLYKQHLQNTSHQE